MAVSLASAVGIGVAEPLPLVSPGVAYPSVNPDVDIERSRRASTKSSSVALCFPLSLRLTPSFPPTKSVWSNPFVNTRLLRSFSNIDDPPVCTVPPPFVDSPSAVAISGSGKLKSQLGVCGSWSAKDIGEPAKGGVDDAVLAAGGIENAGKGSFEDPATSDSIDVVPGWFLAGGNDMAKSAGSIARRDGSIANSEGSRAGSCELSRAGSSEDELAGNRSGKKEVLDEGSSGCWSDDDAKMASKSPAGMSFNNASNSSKSELPGTFVLVFWPSEDIGGNIEGRNSAPVVGGVSDPAVSATTSF